MRRKFEHLRCRKFEHLRCRKTIAIHKKLVKGLGGCTDEIAKEEAIALWNTLRYEKKQYRLFLLDFSQQPEYLNELNVHHSFNPSTTVTGIQRLHILLNYIMILGEPLGIDKLRNKFT